MVQAFGYPTQCLVITDNGVDEAVPEAASTFAGMIQTYQNQSQRLSVTAGKSSEPTTRLLIEALSPWLAPRSYSSVPVLRLRPDKFLLYLSSAPCIHAQASEGAWPS